MPACSSPHKGQATVAAVACSILRLEGRTICSDYTSGRNFCNTLSIANFAVFAALTIVVAIAHTAAQIAEPGCNLTGSFFDPLFPELADWSTIR